MKNKLIFLVMIFSVLFGTTAMFAKTRIAILEFTPKSDRIPKDDAQYMTESFTIEMVNSQNFVVVERAKLDAALKEMQLQNGDMFDEKSAVDLGNLVGAEMVFYGTITRFGGQNRISVFGMDVRTATVEYAVRDGANVGDDMALEEACKRIAKKIKGETQSLPTTTTSTITTTTTTTLQPIVQQNYKNYESNLKLTYQEERVKRKYLDFKWGIEANDYESMKFHYKQQIGGGAAMAAIGGTFTLSSIIVMSVLIPQKTTRKTSQYVTNPTTHQTELVEKNETVANVSCVLAGAIVGPFTLVPGIIFLSLSSIPFTIAHRLSSIYRKATGEKLTFFDRTSIGGGYDWDKKEVTVAMAIKL